MGPDYSDNEYLKKLIESYRVKAAVDREKYDNIYGIDKWNQYSDWIDQNYKSENKWTYYEDENGNHYAEVFETPKVNKKEKLPFEIFVEGIKPLTNPNLFGYSIIFKLVPDGAELSQVHTYNKAFIGDGGKVHNYDNDVIGEEVKDSRVIELLLEAVRDYGIQVMDEIRYVEDSLEFGLKNMKFPYTK